MSAGNEVRFVAFTEEGKENVEAVYRIAIDKDLKCTWIAPEEAADVTEYEEDVVYVADPVEGEDAGTVVDHLVGLNYPVLGPQCAMTVLKHGIRLKADFKYPIYALTMLDMIVCFSNILLPERARLVRLVELMGGKVSGPLHTDVTHLVVSEVGSVKYFSATSCNIKIMVKDWIHHLWKLGQSRYICAKEGNWEDFYCPIFRGCSVCLTGFGTIEKSRIQKLVTKFGGEYSGAMKLHVTTHLVVNKPEGQKYAMASKFGIKTVNVDWVYDSIEKGACQDNMKYPVKTEAAFKKSVSQSTPESHAKSNRIDSMDVSCIAPSMVDETVASTMNDTSRMSTIGCNSTFLPPPTSSQVPVSVASARQALLSFPIDKDYPDILDGINVYLIGFTPNEEEKMKQLLSLADAIKYNQLTSSVSHVIIGASLRLSHNIKSEISSAAVQNCGLCVVRHTWVLECLKKGELVPEKDHWEKELLPLPANHNMSVDNAGTTMTSTADVETELAQKTTVKKKFGANRKEQDRNGSMLGFLGHGGVDDDEMLSQYMNPPMDNDTMTNAADVGDTVNEGSSFMRRNKMRDCGEVTATDVDETEHPHQETTTVADMSSMQSDTTVNGCFNGKTFIVLGFDSDEMQHIMSEIEENGGYVLAVNSKRIADYALVPLTGWPVDRTVQDIVTNFWLELSISQGCAVPVDEHPMSTPFSVPPDSLPLQGCITCLSKYQNPGRLFLSRLIGELGGVDQEIVARRDITTMKKTTHLIISEPGGDKYNGCKNWGMFIVTAEWVYECARKGKKLNEEDFSPDKQRVKEPPKLVTVLGTSTTAPAPLTKTEALTKGSKVKQSSYTNWNTEFPPMPRPPSMVDKIRKRLQAKADAEQKAREEAIKNKETPLHVRYKRLRLETPSKFMTKGAAPVNVSFDLDEVFELLKTPKEQQAQIMEKIKKNPDTPMSEFISRCLDEAVANIPDHLIQNLEKKLDDSLCQDVGDDANVETNNNDSTEDEENGSKIFDNLVLSLAKKLHKQFAELSKIVTHHGGEFRWTYDKACTHFLFQGKLNDKNKEFCLAKKDGKYIVSPHWINACIQTNSRIDETLFPHVYDPNKSIQVVTTSPAKTRRRTLRNTNGRSEASSSSTASEEDPPLQNRKRKGSKDHNPESQDSQEARENLRKKLEKIMSATSAIKETHIRRLSCSRTNTPSPSIAVAQRRTAVGMPLPMKELDQDKTELSQDVQVSWDDPVGREEMERLMRQNETTANDSSFKIPDNLSCLQLPHDEDEDVTMNLPQEEELNEFEDENISQIIRKGRKPRFIVSSVSPQEKTQISSVVNELGGEFSEAGFLDAESTHLLVAKPARSEKFLSALASGKWILHTRYLTACKEAGRFVKEDSFEYGNPENPNTENMRQKPDELQSQMSLAAHRWRKKLDSKTNLANVQEGAFSGWKVLLHVNDRQLKGFERLLKCGCAEVVSTQLPLSGKPADITHAFIDADQAKQLDESVIQDLVTRTGIHVCLPNYIGEYLIKDPLPEPHSHYLPQVSAILEKLDQENDGRETKRRKIDEK